MDTSAHAVRKGKTSAEGKTASPILGEPREGKDEKTTDDKGLHILRRQTPKRATLPGMPESPSMNMTSLESKKILEPILKPVLRERKPNMKFKTLAKAVIGFMPHHHAPKTTRTHDISPSKGSLKSLSRHSSFRQENDTKSDTKGDTQDATALEFENFRKKTFFEMTKQLREKREETTAALEKETDPDLAWMDSEEELLKQEKVLHYFHLDNPIRKVCLYLNSNPWFDSFILLVIIINCVFLALDDNPEPGSVKYELFQTADTIFLSIFTVEMFVKIIATGFLLAGHRSYLRNNWNVLDFVVVVSGYIGFFMGNVKNLSMFRTFRIMRPLRTIKNVRGMRVIITALIASFSYLLDVLALFCFLLIVFGILGVQIYGGKFHQRCFEVSTGKLAEPATLCSFVSGVGSYCDRTHQFCALHSENLNFDVTSFDNILVAFVTIIQVISLEGWVDIMYHVNEIDTRFNALYFMALVVLGSWFTVNLITAVIFLRFEQIKRTEEAKELAKQVQKQKSRKSLANISSRSKLLENKVTPLSTRQTSKLISVKSLSTLSKQDSNDALPPLSRESTMKNSLERKSSTSSVMLERKYSEQNVLSTTPPQRQQTDSGNLPGHISSNDGESEVLTTSESEDVFLSPVQKSILNKPIPDLKLHEDANNPFHINPKSPQKRNFSFVTRHLRAFDADNDNEPSRLGPLSDDVKLPPLPSGESEIFDEEESELKSLKSLEEDKKAKEESEKKAKAEAEKKAKAEAGKKAKAKADAKAKQSKMLMMLGVDAAPESNNMLGKGEILYRDHIVMKSTLTKWELKFFGPIYTFISSDKFQNFVTGAIVANTIVLAMDHWGISEGLALALYIMNFMFYLIFTGEMILKLIGMGGKMYFSDHWNKFDCLVVAIGTIEVSLSGSGQLSILRSFRLLRVLQLFRKWKSLRSLLDTVLLSIEDLFYFSLILVLFIFIYAVLGIQLFQGKMKTEDGLPTRANFDSFGWALVTVFQIMTGENWNEVMWDAVAAIGWGAAPYFVSLFFAGNYIVLSTFLAIMLGNFDKLDFSAKEDEETTEEVSKYKQWFQNSFIYRILYGDNYTESAEITPKITAHMKKSKSASFSSLHAVEPMDVEAIRIYGKSLNLISSHNHHRQNIAKLTYNQRFDQVLAVLIVVSVIMVAIDTPFLDHGPLKTSLFYGDIVVTALFTLEMSLKIIALGFIAHKGAYLRDTWNILDFLIVVTSILNLSLSSLSFFSNFRLLRVMRALRPLRLITRFENLRVIVQTIVKTIPSLGSVFLVAMLFFTIFAIIGTQLFQGRLWRCWVEDEQFVPRFLWEGSEANCDSLGGIWRNGPYHWDNFLNSLLVLFEISSKEMWPNIMYSIVDSTSPGLAPVMNNERGYALYFVIFVVIGSWFIVGLFVGVVVDEYSKMHDRLTASDKLNDRQQFYLEAYKDMVDVDFPVRLFPLSVPLLGLNTAGILLLYFRRKVFVVCTDPRFDMAIMVLIILNILVMCLDFSGASEEYKLGLEITNIVFTYIFVGEMVIKLLGIGAKQYFRDIWNDFDAFIVFISILTIFVNDIGVNPTVFKVFRVLRIFRLVKRAKGIRQLISTLVFSFPALWNVGSLMFLQFFVYAVVGMNLLGNIKHGDFLNSHANFSSFTVAMITLFRMATGENWNGIMHDCMIQPPDCSYALDNCGEPVVAILFFCSFNVLSTMLLLNVFVAVVLKNFQAEVSRDPTINLNPINQDEIKIFVDLWVMHSGKSAMLMPVADLPVFLRKTTGAFRMPPRLTNARFLRFAKRLRIPVVGIDRDHVHYLDVCLAIASHVFFPETNAEHNIPQENQLLASIKTSANLKFPVLKTTRQFQYTAAHVFAVLRLQSNWRKRNKTRYRPTHGNRTVIGKIRHFVKRASVSFTTRIASRATLRNSPSVSFNSGSQVRPYHLRALPSLHESEHEMDVLAENANVPGVFELKRNSESPLYEQTIGLPSPDNSPIGSPVGSPKLSPSSPPSGRIQENNV